MSQRVNRAFYSEPLISFPGRLHVTAEKSYIEVLMKEDGKRTFRTFPTEEYNTLINLLTEQDFYQKGYAELYKKELFDISKKAEQIQDFLFIRSSQSVPKHDKITKEKVFAATTEFKVKRTKPEEDLINTRELLGNIIGGVERYILSKESSKSSKNWSLLNRSLYEQTNPNDIETSIIDEDESAITSKYTTNGKTRKIIQAGLRNKRI